VTYRTPATPEGGGPSNEEILEQFQGIFADLFGRMSGKRVLPYVPSAKKAEKGGTAKVVFERFSVCERCSAQGCNDCDWRGGRFTEEKLVFEIPPGVGEGHRLELPGAGDRWAHGRTTDVAIEITHDPVRATALETSDQAALANRKEAVAQARAERIKQRRRTKSTLIGLGVAAAAIAGIVAITWAGKNAVGERCRYQSDCRSGQCLLPTTGFGTFGVVDTERGGVCTQACTTSDDCPGSMKCLDVHRTASPWAVTSGTPNARACSY